MKRPCKLILVYVIVILLAGCNIPFLNPTIEPESITLKLTWEHNVQFLGFYMAQTREFYADEGLSVVIEPLLDADEWTELPARVATGEFDFSLGAGILVDAQAQGVPVTAVAKLWQFSPLTLMARADSGIKTPADLAGRRVAVKGEAWRILLEKLLATQGLTLDDIIEVPVGFDLALFYEGEVDVWVGFLTDDVVRARQQGLELVTFPLYEYGIEDTNMALFTSQQLLNDNPDTVIRFLRATLRGWEWALQHPDEAVDSMIIHFPELAADRAFHVSSFDALIPLIQPSGTRLGAIDCQQWVKNERFADLNTTEGLCTTSILEAVW